ncbi:hypothetical protein NEOLEDRAFT_1176684 [Neolentinus lepideus HHB14362 ss-1]|uniref:non-specific serine/threonine protein kinase n=1 Tax=Neolentinus lepideus HHB14362 ss-1 TaxID=1314782 RepID=A0A165U5N4_9AGAM|nr:hypothetical protein NEOLEDRAFT_1176684 [Neolentinus lepideus HHB14362 ss-1]
MAMAMVQQAQAYQVTSKGTLVPGQTISVNKYTVQVERYLSQGGFAHVYLVRTAQPVFNTHHHVLKRIAVQNEAMLSEVKKEVDIMRILRGHPNIVYLIDAAWHRMPNGMYEVFILMEFCQGGGIIDMMNRRLRERLTEAEILQMFVDVCEGVAAMHNLRPPLLHRDLKVENILQASSTSYKLCDFGSAAPVAPRVPSTTAEIRALEADLNRHTTLQYRAPEMVDPYLRRPVDEKSDVWALGVLLYKLCYYTTPFEEHGPLAILNVQYKIPPYPVYSANMNNLIASMLREHGTQRPSVFEVLVQVHRLRGTKSRFTYNIPAQQPISPRSAQSAPPANPLDDLISYRSPPSGAALLAPSPPVMGAPGSGVQARDKVLEAIAPMRRGRPTDRSSRPGSPAKPSVPQEEPVKDQPKQASLGKGFDMQFGAEEDQAWKAMRGQGAGAVRGYKSGLATVEAWKVKSPVIDLTDSDPWLHPKADHSRKPTSDKTSNGFGDSFTSSLGLSSSSEAAAAAAASSIKTGSSPSRVSIPPRPPSATPRLTGEPIRSSRMSLAPRRNTKDAFEGLGLSSAEKAPIVTLGEAGRSRTELTLPEGAAATGFLPSRPTSSNATATQPAQASYFTHSPIPPSPKPAWGHTTSLPPEELSPEQRFPSLEELDRTFGSPSPGVASGRPRRPTNEFRSNAFSSEPASLPPRAPANANVPTSSESREPNKSQGAYSGARSQQVTGIAMREVQSSSQRRFGEPLSTNEPRSNDIEVRKSRPTRPSLSRKHRSSVSIKQTAAANNSLIDMSAPSFNGTPDQPSGSPPSLLNVKSEPRDWLTGTDDEGAPSSTTAAPGTPVLRNSPSKRASVIQGSGVVIPPARAVVTSHATTSPPSPSLKAPSLPTGNAVRMPSPIRTETFSSQLTDNWSPIVEKPLFQPHGKNISSSSGSDEGPEDVNGHGTRAASRTDDHKESRRRKARSKSRQSSVHDLVDLWGGSTPHHLREKDTVSTSEVRPSTATSIGLDAKVAPATGSPSRRRSNSPEPLIAGLGLEAAKGQSPKRRFSVGHRKQPSVTKAVVPSPMASEASARSRPQSMFIFPVSKTTTGAPTSAPQEDALSSTGLKAPEHSRRSSSRRTSISDMVQMYESRAKAQTPVSPPPTSAKPANLKLPPQVTSPGHGSRFTGISPTRTSDNWRSGNTGQGLQAPSRAADGAKDRISPTGLPRESTGTSFGSGLPDSTTTGSNAYRSVPLKQSFTAGPSSPERPRLQPLPIRKPTASAEESSTPQSPDKPYQGVGKLIDQWQRKTAEAERSSSNQMPRRGGFTPRRGVVAPTVPGGAR